MGLTFAISRNKSSERYSVPQRPRVDYGVYYRDYLTKSLNLLGTIEERRRKERGNNWDDLLKKARKDFGNLVRDPFAIILLHEEKSRP